MAKTKPKKPAKAKTTKPEPEAQPATAYERLSLSHQQFVDEYLCDHNATRAYMRVPAYKGTTYESAQANGHRLIRNDQIQAALAERQEAIRKRLELTADNVLRQVARMALVDTRRLYREDGTMKAPHELDDDTEAAIQSVEVFEEYGKDENGNRIVIGHTRKVRLIDRKGAAELAMKNLGLVRDKVEIDPSDSFVALMLELQGAGGITPVRKPQAADDEG